MGGGSSVSEKLREEVAALPTPAPLENIWMASCRSIGYAASFSRHNLLFQPDCRNFCPLGTSCTIQHTPECEYIHAKANVLSAQACLDCAEQPAAPVLNVPGFTMQIPFVRRCWSLRHDAGIDAVPRELVGRNVVVFVHGFRQTYHRNIALARHLRHILTDQVTALGREGDMPIVICFFWPACFNEVSYVRARTNAWHARHALRELLNMLQRLRCHITIVGHSLGCKASLTALHRVPEEERGVLPCCDTVAHLILLSPAVPSNSLCSTGRFPREHIAAEKITIVSSENDKVLQKYYPIGEVAAFRSASQAMGLIGPDPSSPLPPGIRWLRMNISHNENSALSHDHVRRCIVRAALGFEDNTQLIPQTLSSQAWSHMASSNLDEQDVPSFQIEEENFGEPT